MHTRKKWARKGGGDRLKSLVIVQFKHPTDILLQTALASYSARRFKHLVPRFLASNGGMEAPRLCIGYLRPSMDLFHSYDCVLLKKETIWTVATVLSSAPLPVTAERLSAASRTVSSQQIAEDLLAATPGLADAVGGVAALASAEISFWCAIRAARVQMPDWLRCMLQYAPRYVHDLVVDMLAVAYDRKAVEVLDAQSLLELACLTVSVNAWKLCCSWLLPDGAMLLGTINALPARRLNYTALHETIKGSVTKQELERVTIYPGTTWDTARKILEATAPGSGSSISTAIDNGILCIGRASCAHNNADLDRARALKFINFVESNIEIYAVDFLMTRIAFEIAHVACSTEPLPDALPEASRWPQPAEVQLTEEQRAAINECVSHSLHAVVGGPGTGKTSVVLKSIASAFGSDVLAVAFTGTATDRMRRCGVRAVTAHAAIIKMRHDLCDTLNDDAPEEDAEKDADPLAMPRRMHPAVLIVEEASAMPAHVFLALMICIHELKSLRRIYFVGDDRQMAPPGGGPSVFDAVIGGMNSSSSRWGVSVLHRSMRIVDGSGALARNLERIRRTIDTVEHSASRASGSAATSGGEFEVSTKPTDGHPFTVIRGRCGRTPVECAEDVATLRKAIGDYAAAGITGSYQLMVHTNERREMMSEAWNATSLRDDICMGERVMFLCNKYTTTYTITNGMIATLSSIFDIFHDMSKSSLQAHKKKEDEWATGTNSISSAVKQQADTGIPNGAISVMSLRAPATPLDEAAAAVGFDLADLGPEPARVATVKRCAYVPELEAVVDLTSYGTGPDRIVRAQPATNAKLQGNEFDIGVVIVDANAGQSMFSAREFNTACSRAKKGVIILTADAGIANGKPSSPANGLPSADVYGIINRPSFAQRLAATAGDVCASQRFARILQNALTS